MVASLKDSAIFKKLVAGPAIDNNLNKINIVRDQIDPDILKQNMFIFSKRVTSAGKAIIMEHVNKDKDFYLISNKNVKLPSYVNFLPLNYNGHVSILINVTDILKGNGEIYPKTFLGYLQNGLITYELTTEWNKCMSSTELVRHSSIAYSRLLCRVLDKLYGVSLYKSWYDYISFATAKFFLVNMCERGDTRVTESIAYNATSGETPLDQLKEVDEKINGSNGNSYGDIFEFCDRLSKNIPYLEKLQIRSVIESWVRLYGESTILAIDNVGAFLQMIFSTQVNAELNNEYRINDTADNAIKKAFLAWAHIL